MSYITLGIVWTQEGCVFEVLAYPAPDYDGEGRGSDSQPLTEVAYLGKALGRHDVNDVYWGWQDCCDALVGDAGYRLGKQDSLGSA